MRIKQRTICNGSDGPQSYLIKEERLLVIPIVLIPALSEHYPIFASFVISYILIYAFSFHEVSKSRFHARVKQLQVEYKT
jgi:hypothetical protein